MEFILNCFHKNIANGNHKVYNITIYTLISKREKEKLMFFLNDSLTVVLVGDWNKLYIQPDWIASNIFENEEMEIGVIGQGADFSISYKRDGIIISPGQTNMTFSVINTDDETLNNLCRCLNSFIEKAYTPKLFAYGLNGDFVEEEGVLFAEVLDSMSDTNAIVENGYEVVSTKVSRVLKRDDRIINMDSSLDIRELRVHFNEHHTSEEDKPNFSIEGIKGFLKECDEILHGLGYEMEGEE